MLDMWANFSTESIGIFDMRERKGPIQPLEKNKSIGEAGMYMLEKFMVHSGTCSKKIITSHHPQQHHSPSRFRAAVHH